jgi:hypothetical protein
MGRQSGAPFRGTAGGFMAGGCCGPSAASSSEAVEDVGDTEGLGDGVGVPVSGSAVSSPTAASVFPKASV